MFKLYTEILCTWVIHTHHSHGFVGKICRHITYITNATTMPSAVQVSSVKLVKSISKQVSLDWQNQLNSFANKADSSLKWIQNWFHFDKLITVWLVLSAGVLCSNAAKTRNLLKLAGVPQTTGPISAASGPSSPYCEDIRRRYCCLTSFFDCWYVP